MTQKNFTKNQQLIIMQRFEDQVLCPRCFQYNLYIVLSCYWLCWDTCLVPGFGKFYSTESGKFPVSTPHGRHSHMSVDIKCLSIDPFYTPILHLMTPPFLSPYSIFPFFPPLYQILHKNCTFSRALRAFWEIYKFCGNFNIKFANFGLKLHFSHWMTPIFGSPHQKRSIFWGGGSPHGMTPFFQRIIHWMLPARLSFM